MNDKEELKKYLKVPKGQKILAIVFGFLLVFCFAMMLIKGTDDKSKAIFFDADFSKEGEYVYLDTIDTDGWIYNDGKDHIYYGVIDQSGYYNNVEMSGSLNKKIEKACDKNEVLRIYGTAEKPSYTIINAFCEVYDISTQDYYSYFGKMLFNANVTPKSDAKDTWAGLTLLAAIFGSIFFSMFFSSIKKAKTSVKRLEERNEITEAKKQLNDYFIDKVNEGYALTDNYIYANPNIINYEDTIWAYVRIFNKTSYSVVLNTAKNKNIEIEVIKEVDELKDQLNY